MSRLVLDHNMTKYSIIWGNGTRKVEIKWFLRSLRANWAIKNRPSVILDRNSKSVWYTQKCKWSSAHSCEWNAKDLKLSSNARQLIMNCVMIISYFVSYPKRHSWSLGLVWITYLPSLKQHNFYGYYLTMYDFFVYFIKY